HRELYRRRGIGFGIEQRLLGQRIHQVEIDVVEVRPSDFDRAARLRVIMYATKRSQMPWIEALHPNRQSGDAQAPEFGEPGRLQCARIGFQRHLGFGHQWRARANSAQNLVERLRRKQTRGPASEEDRMHAPAPYRWQSTLQVQQQRLCVLLFWQVSARLV